MIAVKIAFEGLTFIVILDTCNRMRLNPLVPVALFFLLIGFIDVRTIHTYLIERFGGLDGLRDEGLFDAAIVKNHPFADGNKRTGGACVGMFLGRARHTVPRTR